MSIYFPLNVSKKELQSHEGCDYEEIKALERKIQSPMMDKIISEMGKLVDPELVFKDWIERVHVR